MNAGEKIKALNRARDLLHKASRRRSPLTENQRHEVVLDIFEILLDILEAEAEADGADTT